MDKKCFRYATVEDTSRILNLIIELAKYEKMEEAVLVTEDVLRYWLFEEKKAEVILALEDEKEVGFALFFYNFSSFSGKAGLFIEDLYVKPEYRKKGYGKALIKQLARIATERGCQKLDWYCLDWNKPSIDFYLSLGAMQLKDWTRYQVTGEAFQNLTLG